MTSKIHAKTSIPDAILELIYEAAGDETRWTDALLEIARWIGAVGGMYFLLDDSAAEPRVKMLCTSDPAGAEEAAATYADKGCLVDPHMPLGRSTPLQTWFFSQDTFDDKFIARNAYFQEVMNPLGVRWVAGSRIWRADASVACLAFQTPVDASRFTEADRARLAAVTPHLDRATRIHNKLRNHAFEAELGVEATRNLGFGVALLDSRAGIMYSNAAADRLFAQNNIFKPLPANRISLVHAKCQREFGEAIAAAVKLDSTALRIVDRDGRPVVNSVIVPVPASARWNSYWQRPLAMLVMSEVHASTVVSGRVLQQLFALTPAESTLANWMLTGRSIKEYADERCVSIQTVRTQLNAVFSKTGTHRQAELVACLAKLTAV